MAGTYRRRAERVGIDWDPSQRLLTITEAAESIRRPASTIRRWISENRLHPTARLGHNYLYLEADVIRVEAETRLRTGTVGAVRDNESPRDVSASGE